MNISLLIVDDHKIITEGISALLSKNQKSKNNYTIIDKLNNGEEAVKFCKNNNVDIIIMDIKMPIMDGLKASEIILKSNPEQKIIILSAYSDIAIIRKSFEIGAKGYLCKTEDYEKIHLAIDSVIEKNHYLSDYHSSQLIKSLLKNKKQTYILSARELEIIKLVTKEYTTKDIAEKLEVSSRTIEINKKKIMEKLNVKNSIGLAMYAIKNKLV